jgi:hypothetical protein
VGAGDVESAIETDITADDADLIAGRPSLTPKTAARINEWLRENELKWRPVS